MKKINLPNKLTLTRVCMIPLIMLFIMLNLKNTVWCDITAAALFLIASLTDLVDGLIARKFNLVTNFGKFLDPIADKLLVLGTLIAVAYADRFAGMRLWIILSIVIILFRELTVTSMRLVVTRQDGTVIAANMLGKIKTTLSVVCIIVLLLEPIVFGWLPIFGEYRLLSYICLALMDIFTVWSGVNYVRKYFTYIDPTK